MCSLTFTVCFCSNLNDVEIMMTNSNTCEIWLRKEQVSQIRDILIVYSTILYK